MFYLLFLFLQIPPSLPDSPEALKLSWIVLTFVFGVFVWLVVMGGVILRARKTIDSMISSSNKGVVEGLGKLEMSVEKLSATVVTLKERDGIVEAALRAQDRQVVQMSDLLRSLDRRLSRIEGRIGGPGATT